VPRAKVARAYLVHDEHVTPPDEKLADCPLRIRRNAPSDIRLWYNHRACHRNNVQGAGQDGQLELLGPRQNVRHLDALVARGLAQL